MNSDHHVRGIPKPRRATNRILQARSDIGKHLIHFHNNPAWRRARDLIDSEPSRGRIP